METGPTCLLDTVLALTLALALNLSPTGVKEPCQPCASISLANSVSCRGLMAWIFSNTDNE